MPGNLRSRSGKKGSGTTEKDYERARRQVIRAGSICGLCGEVVDKVNTKPICRMVSTDLFTVYDEVPRFCTDDGSPCDHPRKPHPFSPSADHIVPVASLRPGDKRLTDPRSMRLTHLKCNQVRGNRAEELNRTSRDWFS